MEMLVVVVVVLFVAGLVVWWAMQRGASAPAAVKREERLDTLAGWPPQGTRILTSAERLAWGVLSSAMPGYMILAQVPIARFTRVPMRNSYSEWLRRIGNHCADLLVCDMASHVIAVVHVQPPGGEPNERSQRRLKRMKRVLKAEEIRLLVWTEGALPTVEAARDAVLGTGPAGANAAPDTMPSQVPTGAGVDSSPPAVAPVAAKTAAAAAAGMPHNPFDDSQRDSTQDERIEVADAPQSTWFDDLETAPAPLDVKPQPPRRPGGAG
jgi:Protein of unknown function (DUF2726)